MIVRYSIRSNQQHAIAVTTSDTSHGILPMVPGTVKWEEEDGDADGDADGDVDEEPELARVDVGIELEVVELVNIAFSLMHSVGSQPYPGQASTQASNSGIGPAT